MLHRRKISWLFSSRSKITSLNQFLTALMRRLKLWRQSWYHRFNLKSIILISSNALHNSGWSSSWFGAERDARSWFWVPWLYQQKQGRSPEYPYVFTYFLYFRYYFLNNEKVLSFMLRNAELLHYNMTDKAPQLIIFCLHRSLLYEIE